MRPLAERFWEKVAITANPDKCWEWKAAKGYRGYGRFQLRQKVLKFAHRVAWELVNGTEPPPLLRHTCDNPPCVNPHHLLPGTQIENVRDRDERGRGAKGEHQHLSKVTEADVVRIRQMASAGLKLKEIAGTVPIKQPSISKIIRRQTWKHVA